MEFPVALYFVLWWQLAGRNYVEDDDGVKRIGNPILRATPPTPFSQLIRSLYLLGSVDIIELGTRCSLLNRCPYHL